ncbi:laminin G domain protein, partial [Cooperia oncophora]
TIFFLESSSSVQPPVHFVALILDDGHLQLFWMLGVKLESIRARETLPMSSWVDIRINLSPSAAAIYVNDTLAASTSLLPSRDQLISKSSTIFLGGVPDERNLPDDLKRFAKGFSGAIGQLKINERPFNIHRVVRV